MKAYLSLIFFVLLFLSTVCAFMSDVFLTWPNILNIFTASATIGILAIGATFIIGSRGLDLSIGSLMAFSTITAVTIAPESSLIIVAICLLTGLLSGAVNGWLIGGLKLPAFIVTLAVLSLARGLALIFSDGQPAYGLPENIIFIGQGYFLGISVPVWIFLTIGLIGYVLLEHTKFGQHSLAIGDNENAARNAGIKITRHKIFLYALSGLTAAIASLLFMGRVNAADPSAGMMYELTAITAVIIGGTALSGGRASVLGSILGALIMGVLQNGLSLMNVPSYYQQVAIGIVLIFAVAVGQGRGVHAAAH